MIPIRDTVQLRNRAWMTWLLIGLNGWVFLVESLMDLGPLVALFRRFLLVPARPQVSSLIGYMFLHAGLVHLVLNMWFLWLFGDNVEDRMGPFRFLFFYLLCGLLAAGMHIACWPDSTVPVLGASGAIAGVMGAFCMMFPRGRLVVVGFRSPHAPTVPGYAYFLIWFAVQLLYGWLAQRQHTAGGVAWWAHIGGFMAGCLLFYLFVRPDRWSRSDPGYVDPEDKPAQARQWPVAGSATEQRYSPTSPRGLDDVAPWQDSGQGGGD